MKTSRSLFCVAAAFAFATSLLAQSPAPKIASTGGVSPHETTSATYGADRRTRARVTLTYGRPYSKDPKTGELRKIWGGLVPWGKANRLGADEATLLLTEKPLQFGATTIPAGAYTLYLVPMENEPSKLAFSSRLGKWGVPVDEQSDVARVELQKSTLPQSVDQLTITIEKNAADPDAGELRIQWETTQFAVPFKVVK